MERSATANTPAPYSLAGHAALVTGSSQGIGLAIARGIHEAGGRVVLHGKVGPGPEFPTAAPFLVADLLDPATPAMLVAEAFAADPSLDLLVCNAGSFFDVPFLQMDATRWEKTQALNARAGYFIAQAFARELVRRKRPGAIVTTCSTNGFQSEEDSTAYDVSKGSMVMMTRTLAQTLAPHRIRVNGIAPGLIETSLSGALNDAAKLAHYERKILQGKVGQPDDCAGAAVFFLSDAARYVTGQILTIDGGLTVGQIGKMAS